MQTICNLITRNTALLVLAAGILGAAAPDACKWIGPHIPLLLGVVMFGMGMTLRVEDFRILAKRPWEVAAGAVLQFTIMPFMAWVLVKCFTIPPELAIGVILVGTCPGGTASNVITYLAKGDVALSVAMTTCTTLLAPFVTPLITWWLAGAWIDISPEAMMMSIVKMVLVPVLAGLLMNHFVGGIVRKCLPVLPAFSALTVVLIVAGVVSLSAAKLLQYGLMIAGIVVLHNGFGLLLGYIMAKALRMEPAKARAMSIEVGMQNSGLATALSVKFFTPEAAVPGAIFSVWHNISGSLVANYFARQDEIAAETADKPA